ncbi:MAG: TolC family protein [Verrucomicrobia bacterium]|nr:TolC family protein [Verrucomicrobiota bacterium]
MKKSMLVILLIAVSALGQTNEFILPEGSLTLAAARRIALEKNPGITRALKNIDASQAVLRQARSFWYPGVAANAGYNRMDVDMQPEWAPDMRYKDSFNDYSASIQASWLVFDGFARRANILASKHGVEQSEQLHTEAQRLLLDAVTAAYVQAQRSLEAMAIAAQDLLFNRMLEGDSQKRYAAGTIPEADLLNFSVRALRAETGFMQAERNHQIACTVLAQLMALPDAALPPDMRPARYAGMGEALLPEYETEMEYALKHRPDLLALKAGCRALQQQVRAKKGAYAPQVALVAGIDFSRQNDMAYEPGIDNHNSYVGVAASWDLFSGGRRPAQVREAAAQLAALEETYSETILHIQSGIRQALETARVAFETYRRNQQAHELTVRIRESVEKSYKAGAASLTRLNEAQTDLTRSAGAAALSRIEYLQALERLATETGRILE